MAITKIGKDGQKQGATVVILSLRKNALNIKQLYFLVAVDHEHHGTQQALQTQGMLVFCIRNKLQVLFQGRLFARIYLLVRRFVPATEHTGRCLTPSGGGKTSERVITQRK
jgi:hypothetical protein